MKYSADYIKEILARYEKILKKSLGQNFLYDKKILDQIVSATVDNNRENVIEIGAGVGLLTELLCQNSNEVVTIEIDQTLPPLLKETVPYENFSLYLKDVLQSNFDEIRTDFFEGEPCVIVGNLPYYITAKILRKLATDRTLFRHAVIMVQKEVADRLQSKPGSKEYRAGTASITALFTVEYICTVPPHCFVPAPHVESAVIRLTPKQACALREEDTEAFLKFIDAAFSARRKQLKALSGILGVSATQITDALLRLGHPVTARAETLCGEELIDLFYLLKSVK